MSDFWKVVVKFISDPFIFDPEPICTQKSQIQQNYIFHWKLRADRVLILTDLDSPMDKCFPAKQLLFSILIFGLFWFSRGNGGSNLDQKCKLDVHPVVVKIWVLQKFLHDSCASIKATFGKISCQFELICMSYCPNTFQIWAQLGHETKKIVVSRR